MSTKTSRIAILFLEQCHQRVPSSVFLYIFVFVCDEYLEVPCDVVGKYCHVYSLSVHHS